MWPIRATADGKKIFSPGYLLSSVSYEIDSEETERRIRLCFRVCYYPVIFLPYFFEPFITGHGLLGWVTSAALIWGLFKCVTLYVSRPLSVWIEPPKKKLSETLSNAEKTEYTFSVFLTYPAMIYFLLYRSQKDYFMILVMAAFFPVLCFNMWKVWKR